MTTTGTYAFNLEWADIVSEAWERCGRLADQLESWQLRSSLRSANLLFVEWGNRGINLWAVEELTEALTQGSTNFSLPDGTIDILNAVIVRTQDTHTTDYIMMPIARDQYAAIPNKDQQGLPFQYWVDRLTPNPTVFIYLTSDKTDDVMKYWRLRQLQDVGLLSNTPDAPYLWLDALCAGLAAKLSVKWAPDRIASLRDMAEDAFLLAAGENVERANLEFSPDFSSYFS